MTNNNKRLIWLIILAVIAYFTYQHFAGQPGGAPPQMPPAPVTVVSVQPADVPVTYEYAGRTAGSREVEIRARITGILLQRLYQEGQKVKAGDVLFKIEPQQSQAASAQAKAVLTNAERDWQRVKELFDAGAVSARERDEALAAVQQARAQNQTASINLDYTTVLAPITGVTSQEAVSEGSLVAANTSLLTRITQLDPMYVNFAYPDTEQMQLRQDLAAGKLALPADQKLQAEVQFGDGSVYPQLGDVNFTDSFIDTATGSINARATIANADGKLMPGQFVRVVVKGFVRKNAIVIPDQAVIQSPMGAIVYVVSADNKAQIRPVKLGMLLGKDRIVDEGLQANDRVITEGMIKVRPDAPVAIDAPATPTSDNNKTEKAPEKAPAQ